MSGLIKPLQIMQHLRPLLMDTAVYTMAKGLPGMLGLLSVFVFLRLIGPEQFGLFSLFASAVVLWSTFASGWLCQGILRYFSSWRTTDGLQRLLGPPIAWSIGGCLVAVVINLSWLDAPISALDIGLALLFATVVVIQSVIRSLWQAALRPLSVLFVEVLRAVVTFAASVLLAWAIYPTASSLIVGAIVGYTASILLGWPRGVRFVVDPSQTERPRLLALWSYGWPLSFWLAIQTAFPWLDRLMMQGSLGLEKTGVFASLSDVVTRSFSLFLFPITLAAYPRLSAMWNRGETGHAMRLLVGALCVVLLLAVPLVAGFHFSQEILISWLLPGPEDIAIGTEEGPYLVGILAINGVLWNVALLAHKPLELRRQTLGMLVLMGVSLIIKIIGNVAMLKQLGMKGAVFASLLAGLIYCTGCLIFTIRVRSTCNTINV